MSTRRVVITGVGLVSPLGNSLDIVSEGLQTKRHGIARVEEWASWDSIETVLGGIAKPYELKEFSRKQRRAMGRVAEMSVAATRDAVRDAALDEALLKSGDVALFYGSTDGSTHAAEDYYRKLYTTNSFGGLLSSMYLRFMSHTCAANIAQAFGITGRVVPICSACTSASQSIGEGYWSIRSGREEVAICGGAEEAHVTVAGVFDLMLATSVKFNDDPGSTPRPFDVDRDGLVIAEGAGTVILESYDRAKARGASIYGEIIGYGSNCDGEHLTSPSFVGMGGAMKRALKSAEAGPDDIDYINAHATGTEVGDIAESRATAETLGDQIPLSSTKSYTGHTLGGCGAIETIFCLAMFRDEFLPPTRNLVTVDPRCAKLNYLTGDVRRAQPRTIMNNNFAFGGINTSLILRRV